MIRGVFYACKKINNLEKHLKLTKQKKEEKKI